MILIVSNFSKNINKFIDSCDTRMSREIRMKMSEILLNYMLTLENKVSCRFALKTLSYYSSKDWSLKQNTKWQIIKETCSLKQSHTNHKNENNTYNGKPYKLTVLCSTFLSTTPTQMKVHLLRQIFILSLNVVSL